MPRAPGDVPGQGCSRRCVAAAVDPVVRTVALGRKSACRRRRALTPSPWVIQRRRRAFRKRAQRGARSQATPRRPSHARTRARTDRTTTTTTTRHITAIYALSPVSVFTRTRLCVRRNVLRAYVIIASRYRRHRACRHRRRESRRRHSATRPTAYDAPPFSLSPTTFCRPRVRRARPSYSRSRRGIPPSPYVTSQRSP